ncbi:hypothetical protein [Streptomyces sp. NBC_01615]|uniref:hypothetical protein n=1 Tax=Streptomyces sp. NBC_01615 TaxID=2975898 RepID=UPI003862DB99
MVLKLVEPAQPPDRFWGTMTDHHTYGTGTHTAGELVRLVSDRLGLVFSERDSYFRGVYHRAGSSPTG